jgi:uncharacterized protein YkwD
MTRSFRSASLLALTAVALISATATGAAIVTPVPTPPDIPLPALPALPPPLGPEPSQPQPVAQSVPASTSTSQATTAATAAATATTATVDATLQRLVAAEINIVRRSYGRSRLTLSGALSRAGTEHARGLALAGYFSHDWSDGTPFGSWIRRFYPPARARRWSAGENLAWSTQAVTAQQAVEMWLASPEHRRILLSKSWRQVGLGVVRATGAGGVYGGRDVLILAAEFGVRR